MELKYYYNSTNKEFIITNGNCDTKGFKKISKEEYERLQEELNAQNENEENNDNANIMVHTANFK